jgi:primosomal protein N' (replication factor Y) (superfamily II helicase)
MYFYEVAPATRQYHGHEPLTYHSDTKLTAGDIVVVKVRTRLYPGFVTAQVSKPSFKTVEISFIANLKLPPQHGALANWLIEYYPAPLGIISQLFLPFSTQKDFEPPAKPLTSEASKTSDLPPLTSQQSEALKQLQAYTGSTLLHGETGTGKTRLYIERAQQVLNQGKSVIVLVPEIALSPQTVKSFTNSIDAPITVTHSGLTNVQRRKAWHFISNCDKPQIIIGPRSALFTPVQNVGLIVVDEFHEPAYKQDQAPYYNSLRVASQLARLHNAQLILGSATPPVHEYYLAEHKNAPIIRLTDKAVNTASKVNKILVSLKESSQLSKFPLISLPLIDAIKSTLDAGEQSLIFLNKRGSARVILCQNCGWHALCPKCDLPLTYHGDSYRLQCHTCGYHQSTPSVCPECSSHDIVFKSPGTKAIVESLQYLFPEARIARFDKDNRKTERLDSRHDEILDGSIDILVGTQLLAKGHDLPRLSLVGILLAENELQFPDFSASERSYQLMHQLIGRVGRGHRDGTVVIQSYDTDSLAVQTALGTQTWETFYREQVTERQQFGFPPFTYLLKIEVSRARIDTVTKTCDTICSHIRAHASGPFEIIGPSPSFIERKNNTYTWQVIVKAKQRTVLTNLARSLNAEFKCTTNLDPLNLL